MNKLNYYYNYIIVKATAILDSKYIMQCLLFCICYEN